MFDRYNENARRTIFFARYEASEFGAPEMESEHLLLGLLREGRSTLSLILGLQNREGEIRAAIDASTTKGPKTSTSADLPLSNECKRILAHCAEEAERLGQKHIGIEHLMLGILREEKSLAARILRERGVQLKTARAQVSDAKDELTAASGAGVREKAKAAVSNLGVAVHIVDANSSQTLLAYHSFSPIPRIGESVLIRDEQGLAQSYRVQDVVWDFENILGFSMLKQVQVRVSKANTE
jgi:ATP-dependent Clp protease ATP-binding subunit ClpA